jgi:hypothetical protein
LEWIPAPLTPKHMVVIVGSDTSGQNIIIMDPATNMYSQISSTQLRTNWNNWRWIHTITMNTNAPADVFLRYTWNYTPHIYDALGNIVAGPDFKLYHDPLIPGDTELWVPSNKKITLKTGFSVAAGRKFRAYRGP